jgi:membrane protease YdiL (CAAX protease family)
MKSKQLSLKWWFISFVLIEIGWTVGGNFITYKALKIFKPSSILATYIIQHLNFIFLIILLLIFIYKIIGTDLVKYTTDYSKFRWSLFFLGFALFFCAAFLVALFSFKELTFNRIRLSTWFGMLVFVLVLTPLQATSEELLFRTTIWRMFGSKKKIAFVFGPLIFTVAHLGNTELLFTNYTYLIIFYYFLSALLLLEMVYAHKGSEAAIGSHIANNLFAALFVNSNHSSLQSIPLFIQDGFKLELDLIFLIIASFIVIKVGSRLSKM